MGVLMGQNDNKVACINSIDNVMKSTTTQRFFPYSIDLLFSETLIVRCSKYHVYKNKDWRSENPLVWDLVERLTCPLVKRVWVSYYYMNRKTLIFQLSSVGDVKDVSCHRKYTVSLTKEFTL